MGFLKDVKKIIYSKIFEICNIYFGGIEMNNEILFKPKGLILSNKLPTETNITSSEYKVYDTLL